MMSFNDYFYIKLCVFFFYVNECALVEENFDKNKRKTETIKVTLMKLGGGENLFS